MLQRPHILLCDLTIPSAIPINLHSRYIKEPFRIVQSGTFQHIVRAIHMCPECIDRAGLVINRGSRTRRVKNIVDFPDILYRLIDVIINKGYIRKIQSVTKNFFCFFRIPAYPYNPHVKIIFDIHINERLQNIHPNSPSRPSDKDSLILIHPPVNRVVTYNI